MKLDNTIKALLAINAVFLGILVFQPLIATTAHAAPGAGRFGNVTFAGVGEGFWLFNHETGEIHSYLAPVAGSPAKYVGKITEAGKPISQ